MLRKLRIVFSVTCIIACAALIVLWVRSYWWADQIYGHTSPTRLLHFGSMRGQFTIRGITNYNGPTLPRSWLPDSELVSNIMQRRINSFPRGQDDLLIYRFNNPIGFGVLRDGFYFPHWCLVIVGVMLAIVAWFFPPRKFTLRALLILVTVTALALTWISLALIQR